MNYVFIPTSINMLNLLPFWVYSLILRWSLVSVHDDGLELICDFIKQGAFPLLRELSLECICFLLFSYPLANDITDEGLSFLTDAIRHGKLSKLEQLVLMNNHITDKGLIDFSNGLLENSLPLKMINLSRMILELDFWWIENEFSDAGLLALAKNLNQTTIPLELLVIKSISFLSLLDWLVNPKIQSIQEVLTVVNHRYQVLYDGMLSLLFERCHRGFGSSSDSFSRAYSGACCDDEYDFFFSFRTF